MADNFLVYFQDNALVGQGYKLDKRENQNCCVLSVKENPKNSVLPNVQMEPVSYVKK